MISTDAKLSIQRIPLENLHVGDFDPRYTSMIMKYVEQLREYPGLDVGYIRVKPSKIHPGMFVIDDGHHRFCAYIIAGRKDMLCVVIEEPEYRSGYCSKCGKYFYSAFIRDGGSGVIDVPKDGFCYGDCEKNK